MWFILCLLILFFFNQKTAYEMRISDWSSDVCSSDLRFRAAQSRRGRATPKDRANRGVDCRRENAGRFPGAGVALRQAEDRVRPCQKAVAAGRGSWSV